MLYYKADSDSDGMPDAWETRYGLDPNDPSDATSDIDNDGVAALDEFLAGTIPSGSLDIDGNAQYDALTDGLLLLRGMFGLDGSRLVTGPLPLMLSIPNQWILSLVLQLWVILPISMVMARSMPYRWSAYTTLPIRFTGRYAY